MQNKEPSVGEGGNGYFLELYNASLIDALLMGVNIILPSRDTACLGIG